MDGVAPVLPGFGSSLALSLASLGIVCAVAWVALRWLARRGIGRDDERFRVLARLPLEPKHTLHLVQVAGRYLLVGTATGSTALLAELTDGEAFRWMAAATGKERSPGPGLAAALRRVLSRRPADAAIAPSVGSSVSSSGGSSHAVPGEGEV